MLYHILYPLRDLWFGFNVFKYITFRAGMAAITAFILCIILGPIIINILKELRIGQYVRKDYVDGIKDHQKTKEGVPTMGGLMIIIAVVISTILWCRLDNDYVILALGGIVWLGAVGFMDDAMKLKSKSDKGIRALTKIIGQTSLALIVGIFVLKNPRLGTELYVPFLKYPLADLGILYLFFVWLVIVGSSNAVNLTDGLDGLAIGCTMFVALTYSVMAYVTGNLIMSKYLNIFALPGAGELTCFTAALVGASLGFLWFNSHPATVFMGDTGSLAIGGSIGIVSVLLKKEVLLLIVGGIFVMEAASVIVQIISYKVFKKRVFRMSPIHHHFQMVGWAESKITIRFWIISVILALLGLASLKTI